MSTRQPLYTELDIQAAIDDYRNGVYKSKRKAAASRGIPESTFRERESGKRQERHKAHVHQQLLTEDQEEISVDWIVKKSEWGLSPRRGLVMEMAYRIADKESIVAMGLTNEIGDKWYERFVKRHSKRIDSSIAGCLERIRHTSCSADAFRAFFDLVCIIISSFILTYYWSCINYI